MMNSANYLRYIVFALACLLVFAHSPAQIPSINLMTNLGGVRLFNTDVEPLTALDSLNQIVFMGRNDPGVGMGQYYIQSTDGGLTWGPAVGPVSGTDSTMPRDQSILLTPGFMNNPLQTRLEHFGTRATFDSSWTVYGNATLDNNPNSVGRQDQRYAQRHYLSSGIGRALAGQFFTVTTSYDSLTTDPDSLFLFQNNPLSAAPITPWGGAGFWKIHDTIPFISPKIAFSPDGNIGWIVALSDLPGQGGDSAMTPITWKTTDGGITWAGPTEVDFSGWNCLRDSIWTVSSITPNPSTSYEFDLTVDQDGNPHILTGIMNRTPGQPFSILPGAHKLVVDITTPNQGNSWRILMIDRLDAFRGEVGDGFENYSHDNVFQIGRNAAGDRIFYAWTDTDTSVYGSTIDNIAPDLYTAGLSLFDSSATEVVNWTVGDPILAGRIHFPHLSQEILLDTAGADTHRLPVVFAKFVNPNVSPVIGDRVYLPSIHHAEAEFTSSFTLMGPNICGSPCINNMCVWPGDAEYDFVVDMDDLLMLGTNFDTLGPVRPNASINWTAQPGVLFPDSTSGINHMHSDCDGNGHVFWSDTLAIQQNYTLTHNKNGGPEDDLRIMGAPTLTLVPLFDSLQVGQAGEIAIQLGDSLNPADSLYGVRFTFHYDPTTIDTNSVHISFTNSWFGTPGTDMIGLYQDFYDQGETEIGMVRTDQMERQGSGTVARISIVAIDNISAKRLIEVDTMSFGLSAVRGIGINQHDRQIGIQGATAIVWDIENWIPITDGQPIPEFNMWPNPANSSFQVAWDGSDQIELRMIDLMGRTVFHQTPTYDRQFRVPVDQLPSDVYFLEVKFDHHTLTKRLVVQH